MASPNKKVEQQELSDISGENRSGLNHFGNQFGATE